MSQIGSDDRAQWSRAGAIGHDRSLRLGTLPQHAVSGVPSPKRRRCRCRLRQRAALARSYAGPMTPVKAGCANRGMLCGLAGVDARRDGSDKRLGKCQAWGAAGVRLGTGRTVVRPPLTTSRMRAGWRRSIRGRDRQADLSWHAPGFRSARWVFSQARDHDSSLSSRTPAISNPSCSGVASSASTMPMICPS